MISSHEHCEITRQVQRAIAYFLPAYLTNIVEIHCYKYMINPLVICGFRAESRRDRGSDVPIEWLVVVAG
jgi:hypothetical protein